MTKSFIKKLLFPVLSLVYNIYSSKERNYTYKGINVKVMPGVFHPGLFLSTKFMIEYLSRIDLSNKNILELGAGSGLISIVCAKQNATVTASDINPASIKNIKINAESNNVKIETIESDLFDNIEHQKFDYIVINPPYFPKNPKNEKELAWFCGSDFEYFRKLFAQVVNYVNDNTKIIMVLSEDCDIETIKSIGKKSFFNFIKSAEQQLWSEMNYIFEITTVPLKKSELV